ncbi:MAG TPA: glycosyltransferase [Puia sp.]|jgi:glycosyltransferase involved in cell wall biosynthesis|nr:glycosyltransferase [Puia sp.]
MKLAIVDPGLTPGGVSRLMSSFLPALRSLRPDWEIQYFGNNANIDREGFRELCLPLNIKVKALTSLTLSNLHLFGLSEVGKFIGYLQQKYKKPLSFLPYMLSGAVHKEIERKTKGFDLVFFPWIYRFQCPKLDCPMVGIMHDFNYKYHFCAKGFHSWTREYLQREIPFWLEKITPVVSTHFIKTEMEKFYPNFAPKTEVIHLAPLSASPLPGKKARKIVADLGITNEYILYPLSTAGPHKNVGSLLAALFILKNRGHRVVLILTGNETAHLRGHVCQEGIELSNTANPDVIGLDYVSNQQMDALIQCALLVINPSLYEAGNGPGLDAWIRGTPVAMSNIPAFQEHMTIQGVKAEIFDPRCPADIAKKIEYILLDPKKAKADALVSQKAISEFTWERTVKQYINLFEKLAFNV